MDERKAYDVWSESELILGNHQKSEIVKSIGKTGHKKNRKTHGWKNTALGRMLKLPPSPHLLINYCMEGNCFLVSCEMLLKSCAREVWLQSEVGTRLILVQWLLSYEYLGLRVFCKMMQVMYCLTIKTSRVQVCLTAGADTDLQGKPLCVQGILNALECGEHFRGWWQRLEWGEFPRSLQELTNPQCLEWAGNYPYSKFWESPAHEGGIPGNRLHAHWFSGHAEGPQGCPLHQIIPFAACS